MSIRKEILNPIIVGIITIVVGGILLYQYKKAEESKLHYEGNETEIPNVSPYENKKTEEPKTIPDIVIKPPRPEKEPNDSSLKSSPWTPPAPITKDLLAYYPFSENADDNSGNNNHGVVYGATLVKDRFENPNSAYLFDGKDDFIEILPSSTELSSIGDFTVILWISFNSFKKKVVSRNHFDRQYIFNGHASSKSVRSNFYADGFSICLDWLKDSKESLLGGIFKLGLGPKEMHTPMPKHNEWTHITCVRSGKGLLLYMNGKLLGKESLISNTLDMNHSLFIGTFGGNNPYVNKHNYSFNGKIDDVKLYSRALSNEEIKEDFEVKQE